MKKNLLLYSRICPTTSLHTIKIFNALKEIDPNLVAIKIDETKTYDIKKEQEFIKQFDNVIVLFTINWFNIPFSLSRYMAYVWKDKDFTLENVNFYNIITAGGSKEAYSHEGKFGHTIDEFLNNYDGTYKMLKATKKNQYVYYGAGVFDESRLNEFVEMIKKEYIDKMSKSL